MATKREIQRNARREADAMLANAKAALRNVRVEARAQRRSVKSTCKEARAALRQRCDDARDVVAAREWTELERALAELDKLEEARERVTLSESDSAVLAELTEPADRRVFMHVRRQIRKRARMSRAEAFFQWKEENPAEYQRIQAELAAKQIERFERHFQKRKPARHAARRSAPETLEDDLTEQILTVVVEQDDFAF